MWTYRSHRDGDEGDISPSAKRRGCSVGVQVGGGGWRGYRRRGGWRRRWGPPGVKVCGDGGWRRAGLQLTVVVSVFAKLQLQRTCHREPLARRPGLSHGASAFTSLSRPPRRFITDTREAHCCCWPSESPCARRHRIALCRPRWRAPHRRCASSLVLCVHACAAPSPMPPSTPTIERCPGAPLGRAAIVPQPAI